MRIILLLLLLATLPVAAQTPQSVVEKFYQVAKNESLRGNARWAAVQPLMTPRFYEAVRKGVMPEGEYTLKNTGVLLFDAGMFAPTQMGLGSFRIGPASTRGDHTVVEVWTSHSRSKQLDARSEIWLLGFPGGYQIDDVYHSYVKGRPQSYRTAAERRYQAYKKGK